MQARTAISDEISAQPELTQRATPCPPSLATATAAAAAAAKVRQRLRECHGTFTQKTPFLVNFFLRMFVPSLSR